MELYRASEQWAKRPPDERFQSLAEMGAACKAYRESAKTAVVPYGNLRVEASGDDVRLVGKAGVPAVFTNWAFGQLASRVGAPVGYLRGLPATLAAQNLNYGLAHQGEEGSKEASLLFHSNGGLVLRAATSDQYSRIWNAEVIERLQALPDVWRPAPAAFDGSRGLYASDHDMFAFLVDNNRRIFEEANDGGLSRGFFVENSEVGAAAFRVMTFLYRFCCGNHIVWGASEVKELAIRHVGSAAEMFSGKMVVELKRYAEESTSDIEAKISAARRYELGKTKKEVLDFVFGRRFMSRKAAGEAYEETVQHSEDGSPRSAWGLAQGLTRISQRSPYADERVGLDRAAARVLEVVEF